MIDPYSVGKSGVDPYGSTKRPEIDLRFEIDELLEKVHLLYGEVLNLDLA